MDLDPGLLVPPSQRSGTGRHTLPDAPAPLLDQGDRISLGGVADEFFSAGDALIEPEPEPLSEEAEPLPPKVQRTPEMDARRARLVRVVATVVGCFAGVLALGVVRASASEKANRAIESAASPPAMLLAAPPSRVVEPKPATQTTPALESAPVAPVVEAKPAAVAAPRAAAPVEPRVVSSPRIAPVAAAAPSVPQPKPAARLPSVANFAARAGVPAATAAKAPTASFAPLR